MNSMVVLFSVMVLAAAKPSLPGIISYAAPAVALAPAAVSHQSRVDIKSSPAILRTDVVAPTITQSIIAEPAIVASPVAYSAPLAVAPAAVSSQSRLDIKSSPAIVSTIATSPLAYGAPLALSAPLTYNAPIAYNAPLTAAYTPSIYAAALAPAAIAPAFAPALLKTVATKPEEVSAPASDASVDAALPVAPTETPEVAAARAAHLEAKAFEEAHLIHKRSVGIISSAPVVHSYRAPIITSYGSPNLYTSPFARIAPVVSSPILTSAYGIHAY